MNVCVLGLGYVGLTLSVTLADCGIKVHGVDSSKHVIDSLVKGVATFSEKNLKKVLRAQINNNLTVSDKIPDQKFDSFIIAVGTPLDEKNSPVMDHVVDATKTIGSILKKGDLVTLRSTVPIGVTRGVVIPKLEEASGLKVLDDFDVAFAPERTAEGVALEELKKNPQIIGASSQAAIKRTSQIFSKMTDTIVPVSSIEVAEMIKLIDNSYRDVHFAYANEIALMCEMLKIDAHECIKSANYRYPRNKIPIPSPGVGGPCLSKDPHILSYVARKKGYKPELIGRSRQLNEYVPLHLALKIKQKLEKAGKPADAKIFIIGFAFKGYPETDDTRNSSTLTLVDELKKTHPNIYGYDPVVKKEKISEAGAEPTTIEIGFKDSDCVIVMNNHESYSNISVGNLITTSKNPCLFVDTWNMFENLKTNPRVIYTGVGIE